MRILKWQEKRQRRANPIACVQPKPLQEHGIPFPVSVTPDAEIVQVLVPEAQAASEIENPGADLDSLDRRLPRLFAIPCGSGGRTPLFSPKEAETT